MNQHRGCSWPKAFDIWQGKTAGGLKPDDYGNITVTFFNKIVKPSLDLSRIKDNHGLSYSLNYFVTGEQANLTI